MIRRPLAGVAIVLAVLLAAHASGARPRATIGSYAGATPVAGAMSAFDPSGAPPFLVPGTTDRERFLAGTLRLDPAADSVVVIFYGDNRPGFRMLTTPWGATAVMGIGSGEPTRVLWGLVNIPVALVQSVLPRLDMPRDVYSRYWSHRFTGGRERPVLAAIERELARAPGRSLVVQTGDVVENGLRGALWQDYVERHDRVRRAAPYLAAPGNHERTWHELGRAGWDAVMGAPAAPLRYWYAVDLPDSLARFVFIDSNLLLDPSDRYPDSLESALVEEQLRWLDSTLAAPVRHRFVVEHHPLVPAGHYVSDWAADEARPAASRRRARLLEILERRHVTALVAGHEHLYQRTWVSGPGARGFWQIITGGGGAPLYHLAGSERKAALAVTWPDGFRVKPYPARSMYHYARLTITRGQPGGAEQLTLDVVHVRSDATVERIDRIDLAQPPPE